MSNKYPRIVLAGTGGDAGKTLLAIGLLSHWYQKGYKVAGFKKGPDFIDAAWLGEAAQHTARNLDVYLTGENAVYQCFVRHASAADISVIEGNRGIFDGMDPDGTFSSAELAKLLKAPVILVMDATKVTRTLAAIVLGCQKMDPELHIAGVILNRVAGARHQRVVRTAIEQTTGVPVLGAIPKLSNFDLLPERHLGLVTPKEHGKIKQVCKELGNLVTEHINVEKLFQIAQNVHQLEFPASRADFFTGYHKEQVQIGYFKDSAFSFYYPENLEMLEKEGADLVEISPIYDAELPDIDGLYIGGGFPETHAELLSKNKKLLREIKHAAGNNLPIYAECGGLIFLSHSLKWNEQLYPMADVLPFQIEMRKKPQGHGYCEFIVDRPNPFFPIGIRVRGHEFHYSTIVSGFDRVPTTYQVLRGKEYGNNREGFLFKQVLASYFHLYALAAPSWAQSFIKSAKGYRKCKIQSNSDVAEILS